MTGSKGGGSSGFLQLVRKRVPGLDGRTASAGRMKGPASGATPSSEGVSRESGLNGPVATGRGECILPQSRFFLVRVSPQGQAGRSGAFEREARVPGGSLRGQPRTGSSLSAERATFRRGAPGGDFRAGGNLGEAGKPKLPMGTGKAVAVEYPFLRWAPQPPRGRAGCRSWYRFSPWGCDCRLGWSAGRSPFSYVPGAALAPGASGPSFAGHKVQGPWSLCAWRPLSIQYLSTRQLNFVANGISPLNIVGARLLGPARERIRQAQTGRPGVQQG